jgi:tetratricopeptide (TPR) repeat protein
MLMAVLCLVFLFAGCKHRNRASVESAEEAWRNGDCTAAAREYENFLQKNPGPQVAQIHFDLGNVYSLCKEKDKRDLGKAQQHYRLGAQSSDPSLAVSSWQRVAEIYVDTNHRYEAIEEYENLVQRYPDTPAKRAIRLAVANLYNDLNNFSQAETEYEKVVKSSSYDQLSEAAYLRIGNINSLRGHFEQAIPALQSIVTNSSDNHTQNQARFSLADIYVKQFRYDEALDQLHQIKSPTPAEVDYIKKRTEQIQRDRQKHPANPGELDWSN